MLAKRVIPTILVRGKTAYKGERFVSTRSIGSASAIARVHAKRGVDELCILDIGATAENRRPDLDLVRDLSADCYVPITVGGGVQSLQDIDALLRAGADKVAIGYGWSAVPDLIVDASARFGKQAIVCILDYSYPFGPVVDEPFLVWQSKWLEEQGAGEIMLQCMTRDGTMEGYALDVIRAVSASVSIPVIASGGCSGYQDMLDAFKAGADACAAGALFAFTDATPRGAAKFLMNHMEVRL